MVSRETGNNAYAIFWSDKQKSIMVFAILANTFPFFKGQLQLAIAI